MAGSKHTNVQDGRLCSVSPSDLKWQLSNITPVKLWDVHLGGLLIITLLHFIESTPVNNSALMNDDSDEQENWERTDIRNVQSCWDLKWRKLRTDKMKEGQPELLTNVSYVLPPSRVHWVLLVKQENSHDNNGGQQSNDSSSRSRIEGGTESNADEWDRNAQCTDFINAPLNFQTG